MYVGKRRVRYTSLFFDLVGAFFLASDERSTQKKIGRGRKGEMEGKSVSAGYFVILILEFFFFICP